MGNWIPDMWERRYASDHKCPHCGSLHCAIYQDDPDREHTSADVSECGNCGENYLTDEGTWARYFTRINGENDEGVRRICPSCVTESNAEAQGDDRVDRYY